ncbi:plant UBX domain-containing protein 9 isoform X2 [Tripterygium wilfordii]|uniref:plant UBX domain-containing protein 9 isoform X2 n=1 Tax=Tripterygium wilfordii TaxID=458696 RepID=UPI0018F84967|nr:plant UBX domain-containing protein 9 isoform X2 [Tripterygium wilfordii]
MATPNHDDVEAFMSITGVCDQALARRVLEEHGGNLDAAVNAHFSEAQRYNISPRKGDNPIQDRPHGILPLLSAVRSFKPSLLLDPTYRRNFMNQIGASAFGSPPPLPSAQAGNYNSGNMPPHLLRPMPFMNVTGTSSSHGQDRSDVHRPDGHHANDNDIEEQMIKAAIEASKQEESSSSGHSGRQLDQEDDELSRAISESLKIVEQEKARPDQTADNHEQEPGVNSSSGRSDESYDAATECHQSFCFPMKWGGISSSELDEAMMLEAALFGQIPEAASNQVQNVSTPQSTSDRNADPDSRPVPNQQSPLLTEQWLVRAQQDVEELLAANEASLPQEPALHDENAITLLVRMPDASRHGCRFLKSDKLKFLFDFIDFSRVVKPGSYRLVRPYPRRVFTAEEGSLSLNELGLTNKQEALFLEMI